MANHGRSITEQLPTRAPPPLHPHPATTVWISWDSQRRLRTERPVRQIPPDPAGTPPADLPGEGGTGTGTARSPLSSADTSGRTSGCCFRQPACTGTDAAVRIDRAVTGGRIVSRPLLLLMTARVDCARS